MLEEQGFPPQRGPLVLRALCEVGYLHCCLGEVIWLRDSRSCSRANAEEEQVSFGALP